MSIKIFADTDIPYRELEVGEMRFILPIGLYIDNHLYRHFTLKDITGNHEIIMGKLEAEHLDYDKPETLIVYATKLLQKIFNFAIEEIEEIPLHDFLTEHKLTIKQLCDRIYLADAIAIFINLKISTYGQNILINGVCPCARAEKIRPQEKDAHDLTTICFRCYEGDEPPIYIYELAHPLEEITQITLCPPRFKQLDKLIGLEVQDDSVFYRLLYTCTLEENIADIYLTMDRYDRQMLKKILPKINIFGPDKFIAMDCFVCGHSWDSPLVNGYNYESFYLSLLMLPRMRKELYPGENPAQLVLDKTAFFLTTGEQAPFSSAKDVYDLTVNSRQFWVKELSNTYEKQKEEMQKQQAKNKAPRRRR